jgi:WD40-like Beta Propeller Repeat
VRKLLKRSSVILLASAAGWVVLPLVLLAQERPLAIINEDCRTFAIAADNRIVYAVPRLKRIKKIVIERDEIWIASPNGKQDRIVDVDKFMPVPPPSTYMVDSLAWSPDGKRIAMNMTTQNPGSEKEPASGGKAVALLDDQGNEIKVNGSQTRFIQNATSATWLADGVNVVYLTGAGPYQIQRVNPSRGGPAALFEGRTFNAVAWDAARNRAFAVSENLSVYGHEALMQLDLLHETVKEIARVDGYQGELSVSPSGKKVAYFTDGDAIEVLDLANPVNRVQMRMGIGRFAWGPSERRVLLKRGPDDQSGDLVWVGLYDGSFTPALYGVSYHAFAIAPDGSSVAVTEPGKNVLRVYPLR